MHTGGINVEFVFVLLDSTPDGVALIRIDRPPEVRIIVWVTPPGSTLGLRLVKPFPPLISSSIAGLFTVVWLGFAYSLR